MNPKSKSEYRREVAENGRVENSDDQTQEQWEEEVEDEAIFAAEVEDGKEWEELPE